MLHRRPTLEQLPAPAQVGKTKVGGIDFNKARMGWVAQAVLALSPSPAGFTASQLAEQVQRPEPAERIPVRAPSCRLDLKKLRGKQIVDRIGKTARYQPIPQGLRAMAALIVIRDKAIKPLLAAAQQHRRSRRPQNPSPLDIYYQKLRVDMQGVFHELGIAA